MKFIDPDTDIGGPLHKFPVTNHSAIVAARSDDEIIRRRAFCQLRRGQGQLSNVLRTCLDGFVASEHKAGQRLKRGGEMDHYQLDFAAAEHELAAHATASTLTPEEFAIGILFGVLVGAFLAFLVALMQGDYYLEIVLPGTTVGLIVGFATQKYGHPQITQTN